MVGNLILANVWELCLKHFEGPILIKHEEGTLVVSICLPVDLSEAVFSPLHSENIMCILCA